jgi:uncharacterized membrane protein YuzA (DUF378 family)
MQNPYAPPETNVAQSDSAGAGDQKPAKPIIPAVIGMFTYGSSSPYALVLCLEQYLHGGLRLAPLSTHIALVLSTLGALAWFVLSLLMAMDVLSLIVGNSSSPYSQIGLMMWISNLVFVVWAFFRIRRFRLRQHTR